MPPINATEEAAILCASQAARRYLLSSMTFRRSLTSVAYSREIYERALHSVEHRAVTRRLTPASSSRACETGPLPEPSDVDPWAVDLDKIEQDSRVVAECPGCLGSKRMTCPDCGGSTRVRCGNCGGRGRVSGQRGMKNCPDCRAKGDRKCVNCRSGKIECTLCLATGRVEAWLVIQRVTLQRVCIHSQSPASEVHSELDSPQDFDSDPTEWRNELLSDSGVLLNTSSLPHALLPVLDTRSERILSSRVQKFASHVFRLRYATALSEGELAVAGQPPSLAASSNWKPLVARRRVILGLGSLLTFGAFAATATYHFRHPWFARYGSGRLILLLTLLTAMSAVAACAMGLLASKARSKRYLIVAALLTGLLSVATSAAYKWTGPTPHAAMAALQAGDLERARIAAQGLQELGIDRERGESIIDAIHLEDLQAAQTLDEQHRQVRATWYSPDVRRFAIERLQPAILRESERLFAERRGESFDHLKQQMADLLQPPEQERLVWQSALLHAEACSNERKGRCASEQLAIAQQHGAPLDLVQQLRAKTNAALAQALAQFVEQAKKATSPSDQKQALQEAFGMSSELQQFTGAESNPAPAALSKQLARVDHQLALAAQKEIQRAARENAQREREQARRERAEQAANRGLRCCDGTSSPSCSCSGSHRGCCSRHGGVCGCE